MNCFFRDQQEALFKANKPYQYVGGEFLSYNKNFDNSGKYHAPNTTQNFNLKKYSVSNRLDLRGFRVEDALDSVELYLDEVSLAGLQEVIIIHGHGTGALKSAVREYLSDSPYVKSFRPGNDSEGGDGVCVVSIK